MTWSIDAITDDLYRRKFVNVPDIIADWLAPYGGLNEKEILDFGCGEGTAALGLALRFNPSRIVGVEIHGEIDNCERYARSQLKLGTLPQRLQLIKTTAETQLSDLGPFDIVYSWSVFEHVRQDLVGDRLKQIYKSLRKGGFMFLQTTPLFYSPYGSHFWVLQDPWCHLRMQHDLLYDTLRAKVSDKGQVEGLIHTYETLNRTTAPNIVNAVEAAGFEVVREYSTKTDIEPSRDLLEVYNYDVLTQEQLVILGRKN